MTKTATPSPALAAALAADQELNTPPAGAPIAAPGDEPAAPADDLNPAKLTKELAANIYGAIMLLGASSPTVRKEITQEDAHETAESIVKAFEAWGVLHWLKGGKYMAAVQAMFMTFALGKKVGDCVQRDRAAAEAAKAAKLGEGQGGAAP